MAVQAETNITTVPFLRDGVAYEDANAILAQDAGRTTELVAYTLMAYNPTTQKWEPFTDETASDGTQWPAGIIQRSYAAADIAAGDINKVPIWVGGKGLVFDEGQLVIENSKTLATVINSPSGTNKSVEIVLRERGMFRQLTQDVDAYQNP